MLMVVHKDSACSNMDSTAQCRMQTGMPHHARTHAHTTHIHTHTHAHNTHILQYSTKGHRGCASHKNGPATSLSCGAATRSKHVTLWDTHAHFWIFWCEIHHPPITPSPNRFVNRVLFTLSGQNTEPFLFPPPARALPRRSLAYSFTLRLSSGVCLDPVARASIAASAGSCFPGSSPSWVVGCRHGVGELIDNTDQTVNPLGQTQRCFPQPYHTPPPRPRM